ncbi:MAG: transglutaminase domain-containing protein [Enhygromyxa sp.]
MPSRHAPRVCSLLAPLLLVMLAVASACTGARVRVAKQLETIDDDALSERARLGHVGAFGELAEGEQRARAAARVAAELGNVDEAAGLAREQLDLARTQLLIVRLEGGDQAQLEQARDGLDEAARFAVRLGDQLLDGRLVVEAAQFLHAPRRERRRIARALTLAAEADLSWGYAALFEAFERDAAMLTALQRLRWRGHKSPGLPYGAPRLAPETLGELGPEGLDLLWTEADRAAIERRFDDLGRWIAALLEADRFEPDALAIQVLLDAIARGELEADEALLPDLSITAPEPLGLQARMLQRHRAAPESRALALFRANTMIASGTFGDAGQLLAELDEQTSRPPTKREAALQQQLAAMVAFESGTAEGRAEFQRWQRKARASKSRALAEWLSSFEQILAPEGHVELARAADRRMLGQARGRARPQLGLPVLASAAVDGDARPRARERALAGLVGRDRALGSKFLICRERKLFDDDCRELVSELGKLDYPNPNYPAGLDALGGAANVRAAWFSAVPNLGAEQLPAVRERLQTYEGTRAAATTDYQAAALFAELAGNRPDLARARLDRYGSILRPETRAVATMALLDLEDGLLEPRELPSLLLELPSADVEAQWFLERWLPGDPAMIAELFPGRSRLARLARGLALARMGAYGPATGELLLATEELHGPAKGTIAGRLAFVADLAGEPVIRDRALGIADAEDPLGFMAPFVRARVAESLGANDEARPAYLQALARRPHATLALEGALRTTPLAKLDLDRVRDVLLLFPGAGIHWNASELFDAAARGELDGPLLAALWLARDDGDLALTLGEPAARLRPTAELGLARLIELLELAQTPADAFPLAAKTLAWIGALPADMRVHYREFELWLTMLIGRDAELEALARAQPRKHGVLGPPALHHSVLLLADARKRRAVDDLLAWSLAREQLFGAQDPLLLGVVADLYGEIQDPALAQYACLRLFERDELELAAERCVPLWKRLGGSPFLAADLGYLLLNDPERARAEGLDLDTFHETAAKLPDLDEDPVWLLNASLWASKRGDDQRGAELRVTQLAIDPIAGEPDLIELGQARYRGALLRQQIVDQFELADRRRFALAAGSAIRGLDLVAAELYARRLLAWLPEALDEGPELTAQAPQLLAAIRPEGEVSDAELRSSALYTLALADLIRDDLGQTRIPKDAMLDLLDAYSEGQGLGAYERIHAQHPSSHVAKLLLMAEYSDTRMREQALALARELVALHPQNPLVLADALPLLTGPEDLALARVLLAEARLRHPDHPWLRDEALPAVLTGAEDRLPAWLRTPEEFERMLASIDPAALDALAPRRRVDLQTSAEAFFVADAELNQDGLGVHQTIPGLQPQQDPEAPEHSRVLFVVREPRASRCEGLGCAEPLIAEWTARNYALLWTRELELPAGRAVEFLVTDGESVIDNLLIPSGGNLFVLISGSTPEDFGAFLPQIALLRESFRPLDWSMSASAAEALRSSGRPLPDDALRFRGRQLLGALTREQASSCPLQDPAVAKLAPETRAELLLDLFLAGREPWQRRALLRCTSPDAPEAARLAFVSLLDEDAPIHEFGREATRVHVDRVLTDTRRVLYQEREPAVSNPSLTTSGEQPAFGLLQVIAALPDEHALALTRELLGRRDPRLRALALAASSTMDYFGPIGAPTPGQVGRTEVERLREVVEAGEAKDALLAAHSLMDVPGAENLAVLRARADKLIREGIEDENSRGLALTLGWALARQLDAKDQARLTKLAAAVKLEPRDNKPKRAETVRKSLEELAEDHAEGRKLLSKRELPTGGERAQRWARERRALPSPRSLEQVAKTPLAELVPGDEWSYVRVGSAGLFASSLEALLRRLTPANPADAYLVRTLIYEMLLQGTLAQLGEEGGLDLSAPIECVSPKGSQGFVCSASVSDRAAVLSNLAAREVGDDAGVSLPLSLATEFAGLPMLLGSLPVTLHSLIEAPADELEPDGSPKITAERLRMVRTVAGHPLEYYATIEIHENRIVVDSEHYLFLGDRLLVFAGVDLAELLLREPPRGVTTLAADRDFTGAVAGWRDGVALQAVDLTGDLGLETLALEVVLDNQGIEFQATATGERKAIGEYDGLDALLPDEHVALAALGLKPKALREYFENAELERCARHGAPAASTSSTTGQPCGLGADDKLPPYRLAEAAPSVLLGWYPEPGDALWQRWVLVLPLDAALRKAIAAEKAPLPAAGQIVEHEGLYWQIRDGALIVASSSALAEDVKAGPAPSKPADGSRPFARFSLDGQRAAAVVRALAERYDGGRRGDYLRVIATMIGLVEQVELRGAWTGPNSNEGQLSATVALNLAESEEELALIDRWLASPEIGNASKLPRHLGRAETESTLRYRIKVHDAEQFVRSAVPEDHPRISAEQLGPDEIGLTVRPSRAVPSATSQPLSNDERERMLGSDRAIQASNPKISEVANRLRVPGDDAATVDAVVEWVHEQIKYEITPSSLDAVTVLERGKGDCTEYALLTVTLLRAAGIPAELREGMAASGDEMVAHAWAAWHDGTRWHEVDPTAGTTSVGSGHLELDVVDVLAMISLGRFEVVAIEAP